MPTRYSATNWGLALAAAVTTIGVGEAALRLAADAPAVPMHVVCDCPYLYALNPRRPGVSPQGLRDRSFTVPKPLGTQRILVLGDSVAYGVGVEPHQAFPKVLERLLKSPRRTVEVVNAGVIGYGPYNETEYYIARGRQLRPDVVILQFCMNDVVDPVVHWHGTRRAVDRVPIEAIPDPARHEAQVLELIGPTLPVIGRGSEVARRVWALRDPRRGPSWSRRLHEEVGGRSWPTYVTPESDLSIRVLLDHESAEWRWLRALFARLRQAVEADGARLALLIVPLAYQLEEGYPFMPQQAFEEYCHREQLACVDPLEELRSRRSEGVFAEQGGDWPDIWHPTAAGHQILAEQLAAVDWIRDADRP